ncbi:unnamed protein product [Sphagnum jensenii]|uniref:DNA-directed DNA polymerase n=1 Tax=Sphagnum jensenii TaxID=128206 RepID=A0ABP0V6I3_9BRYO
MSWREMLDNAGGCLLVDIEAFPNFFLVAFKLYSTDKVYLLKTDFSTDTRKLSWILHNYTTVGFNSKNYDIPLMTSALNGLTASELYAASTDIVVNGLNRRDFYEKYSVKPLFINNVDLIEVAPLKGSLKLYAARLHAKRIQDLPYNPHTHLMQMEQSNVVDYCVNDLINTELLMDELNPQLHLRVSMSEQYHTDLRSKSDAQMAEAVIAKELERMTGEKPKRSTVNVGTTYFYKVPQWLHFESLELKGLVDIIKSTLLVVSESGNINLPEAIADTTVKVNGKVYRIGIGGLHSTEKCVAYKASADEFLLDRDVVSYYPSIILNEELYPEHLGRDFLKVYRSIVNRRIAAKKAGDKVTADSLKITINGSFGKFGNMYSILYAPDLLMQVTLTGQLALLMLIEMLEDVGVSVLSANTDGVLVKVGSSEFEAYSFAVAVWEKRTGFKTEEEAYKAVYMRDVNNYIAIKLDDDGFKTKGTYSDKGSAGNSVLSRNPEAVICNYAVIDYLRTGLQSEDTIRNCKDIRRFCFVRNVKGGAKKNGKYLGKTVRFYISNFVKGYIEYKETGNKVPLTDNARPLMELVEDLPTDLDYDWYIRRANDILMDIGAIPKPQLLLFH